MLAVIQTGGKQYVVRKDDKILVEKLEQKPGESFEMCEVLLVSDDKGELKVGTPFVENCSVAVTVEAEVKGDKLTTVKYKKRKNYKRTIGHRQKYYMLKVDAINC